MNINLINPIAFNTPVRSKIQNPIKLNGFLSSDTVSFSGQKNTTTAFSDKDFKEFISYIEPIYKKLGKKANSNHLPEYETANFLISKQGNSKYTVKGVGTKSICYEIPVGDKKYAIKFYRPDVPDCDGDPAYLRETFALKKLKEMGVSDIPEFVGVYKNKDKYYLVTSMVEGKMLDGKSGNILNKERCDDVLKKLALMDEKGFIQFDAQYENILFDGNTAQLIDFGGAAAAINNIDKRYELMHRGVYMPWNSFYPFPIDMLNSGMKADEINKMMENNTPYLGFVFKDCFAYTRNSNPYFGALSNVANFEYRTLFPHLIDVIQTEGKESAINILKTYLHSRSSNYHEQMLNFFNSTYCGNVQLATNCYNDFSSQIEEARRYEEDMMYYLSSNDIDENILKTELAKIQIRWVLCEEKGCARSQFEELYSMIQELKNAENGKHRKYYDNSLKFFDQLKPLVYAPHFDNENRKLDDSYNLVKILTSPKL